MTTRNRNTRMFALPARPQEQLDIGDATYRLMRVFKHDFWAATCLYETSEPQSEFPKVVVKFGRSHPYLGVPLQWVGRFLAGHEEAIYAALAGLGGVPRWVERLSPVCYAIEYVEAVPLDHLETPPPGFFDRLRELFQAVHARGVAYGDANKKSNILVTADGRPVLIDFQISLRRRDDWPWPLRAIVKQVVEYLADKDLYHLYKHKRRLASHELTPEEETLSRRRGRLHQLHRKITKPYRRVRRRYLKEQYEKGKLQSPTAEMEDHRQPEKSSWRNE